MYRVLLPIDRSVDRATAQAEAVTRLPAADEAVRATVLHVFEDGGAVTDPTDLEAGERAREALTEAGVEVETVSRVGDPAGTILSVAEDTGADALVLGGRKRSPLGSLLFGSVSQSVLLDADRPVTITGADVKEDPSHRCQSCGKVYYARPGASIRECRRCGGTHVEAVADVSAEGSAKTGT